MGCVGQRRVSRLRSAPSVHVVERSRCVLERREEKERKKVGEKEERKKGTCKEQAHTCMHATMSQGKKEKKKRQSHIDPHLHSCRVTMMGMIPLCSLFSSLLLSPSPLSLSPSRSTRPLACRISPPITVAVSSSSFHPLDSPPL